MYIDLINHLVIVL